MGALSIEALLGLRGRPTTGAKSARCHTRARGLYRFASMPREAAIRGHEARDARDDDADQEHHDDDVPERPIAIQEAEVETRGGRSSPTDSRNRGARPLRICPGDGVRVQPDLCSILVAHAQRWKRPGHARQAEIERRHRIVVVVVV